MKVQITFEQVVCGNFRRLMSEGALCNVAKTLTGDFKDILHPEDLGCSDDDGLDYEPIDLDTVRVYVDDKELSQGELLELAAADDEE